ncbi:innate immunity activator protein-like isoform X2 [Entelurus aequoreus]|uniref:innate immunity activator protein-like isoform X2 n=1 Tax=Entelurus aequoreus TaxID=161455 RepID=UPI002B1E5352|nr:innate immunity activator protein-like isoform X2 [Entelurus aequoreus]
MEVNGEVSDSDSGIILHSGSDSPTSHAKDVSTHTRAMRLKHQALQERLDLCLLELKKVCIREAELTGRLSGDYPLLPGEKLPQIRKRIGAAFLLDQHSIPGGGQIKESALNQVDAELALQFKIYEAARQLCQDRHLAKAVRKSRLKQCRCEEKKLRHLQETAFQLRLEHGRSSPLPAFSLPLQDLGASDDSSLSDSLVQDEEVASKSSGLLYHREMEPPTPVCMSSESHTDSPSQSPSVGAAPDPGLDAAVSLTSSPAAYDPPPIQHSPWSESSLDQPYQKKSRSSCKASPTKAELLPPLEADLAHSSLPQQLSRLKVSRTQSGGTPSTPQLRVHRQLSLRMSNESPLLVEKERGRTRGPRRRLLDDNTTTADAPPLLFSRVNDAWSEDSNSEHSFASYTSSPTAPRHYHAGFYHSPRLRGHQVYHNEDVVYPPYVDTPWTYRTRRAPGLPDGYEYRYQEAPAAPQRAQWRLAPDGGHSPQWDPPRQVVSEQLKSWHRRSQLKGPRSRSLDRQGAVRVKNTPARELPRNQNPRYHEQVIQRRDLQMSADDSQGPWLVDHNTHYVSQV